MYYELKLLMIYLKVVNLPFTVDFLNLVVCFLK